MSESHLGVSPDSRPKMLHVSRSFPRMDNALSPTSSRKRSNTVQEAGFPAIPEARHFSSLPEESLKTDVFEKHDEDDVPAEPDGQTAGPELQLPSDFDELPIEVRSLTERFLEGLSAKVHPTPLNADNLSELFQDFYERAASHVATHIASLSSRIGREKSTSTAAPSAGSGKNSIRGRSRANSGAKGSSDSLNSHAGGEMLTASEFADRKKARKLLEVKRLALEEKVERTVCESVYGKLWKHKSTDDDARDEKLRSRTAALAVVGIGLKELHMDHDPAKENLRRQTAEKEDEISQSLANARQSLQMMDSIHHPLGKLQCLTAAHKSIVETLSEFFPSSSSADEVLPTLIFTLITSPPEGVNAISNLNFIQRFRAAAKVNGEAAYCLVNLEAAISFLETVDLSSLRADELPQGPPRSNSRPSTPTADRSLTSPSPAASRSTTGLSSLNVVSANKSNTQAATGRAPPSPSLQMPGGSASNPRRLSAIVQYQAGRLETGRENFLNAADRVYDSINGTLDNSLQFIFGKFKERVAEGESRLPKTLEDARKLISPRPTGDDDESLSLSGRSSPAIDDPLNSTSKSDNKMLELLGGRRQLRDQSADSARSGGSSSRRVAFSAVTDKIKEEPQATSPGGNLFASINPLNRFGMPNIPNIPNFSRFGRASPSTTASPTAGSSSPFEKPARVGDYVQSPADSRDAEAAAGTLEKSRNNDSAMGLDDLNAREALAELRKIKPPKKRFIDVQSASELKIGEVEDLLLEYRRLAKAIGDAIAA